MLWHHQSCLTEKCWPNVAYVQHYQTPLIFVLPNSLNNKEPWPTFHAARTSSFVGGRQTHHLYLQICKDYILETLTGSPKTLCGTWLSLEIDIVGIHRSFKASAVIGKKTYIYIYHGWTQKPMYQTCTRRCLICSFSAGAKGSQKPDGQMLTGKMWGNGFV